MSTGKSAIRTVLIFKIRFIGFDQEKKANWCTAVNPRPSGRGVTRVGVGLVLLPTSLFLGDPGLKAGVSSRRDEP